MDRTNDFFQEIRAVKKKQGIPTETDDIIRPKIQISPFLKTASSLYERMKLSQRYISTFSKQWKNNKIKLSEKSEVEFEEFENEISSLLKDIENKLSEFEGSQSGLVETFTQEIHKDLKDNFTESKKLYQSVVDTHSSYQRFASILKPSLSSSLRMKDITDKPTLYSKGDYNTFMSAIAPEERDRLMSENVQIEKSLERELDAVKQVEKNTRELTHLVSVFNQHVEEQHDMIDLVHENTEKAKEYVDEGLKHLTKAEENNRGTRLKLAYLIFILTFILLIYNWLKSIVCNKHIKLAILCNFITIVHKT